jgi:hypothetical protein
LGVITRAIDETHIAVPSFSERREDIRFLVVLKAAQLEAWPRQDWCRDRTRLHQNEAA